MTFLEQVVRTASDGKCLSLAEGPILGTGKVIVLAPHPDDPDACAVLQRMFRLGGWDMRWLILTSAWSGVRDEFVGADKEAKASARRREQFNSARIFGIPDNSVTFLDLPETDTGELADIPKSHAELADRLTAESPEIVMLPWGQDTNATHRLVFEWFERWRSECERPVTAFYFEDPKTLDFEPHVRVLFDEETARWKASLLECHRSQTDRNIATRGITFAERILAVNRAAGEQGLYAERYRVSGSI